MSNDNEPTPRQVPAAEAETIPVRACPICSKPAQAAYRPFCSKRCADVDLSRWLNGVYAVPVTPTDEEEDEDR